MYWVSWPHKAFRLLRRVSLILHYLNNSVFVRGHHVYFCKYHQMSDTDLFSTSCDVQQGGLCWWDIQRFIFLRMDLILSSSKQSLARTVLLVFKAPARSPHSPRPIVDSNDSVLHDDWSCQSNCRALGAGGVSGVCNMDLEVFTENTRFELGLTGGDISLWKRKQGRWKIFEVGETN